MNKKRFAILTVTALTIIFVLNTIVPYAFAQNSEGQGYMKFDPEDLELMQELRDKAERANIDPETVEKYLSAPGAHYDLLSHLNYVPGDRDQGYCGNCWVWAATGITEVALDVQEGIYDRLSIQYFDSCWTTDYACCGGFIDWYADWTELEGYVLPWSNTNAHWQDWGKSCSDGSSDVACGTISTTPQYVITKCDDLIISTTAVSSATAIANIKAILHSNKGVWFGFWLTDWYGTGGFSDHWNNYGESAIWDPPTGGTWGTGSGAHAVLCVGYDDTDPDNPYWIVVNSWGTTASRPNGIFRLSMNMDYDGTYTYGGSTFYSFEFATLDVEFDIPDPEPVGGVYSVVNKLQVIYPWAGLFSLIGAVVILTSFRNKKV